MIFRPTRKLLTSNKIKPEEIQPNEINTLNEWLISSASTTFKGKTLLIFIHAPSFMTVVVEGKSILKKIPEFETRLIKLLQRSCFPEKLIDDFKKNLQPLKFATNTNKSYIGRTVNFVQTVEDFCSTYYDYSELDLDDIENNLFSYLYFVKGNLITAEDWWNNYIHGDDLLSKAVEPKVIKASTINKLGMTAEEELYMENQMLKMDLEHMGGNPIFLNDDEIMPKLPLNVENFFLRNIKYYESKIKDAELVTIYELLGKPKIKKLDEIKSEADLLKQFLHIDGLLKQKQIVVEFFGKYSLEICYSFIVDEIMQKKVPNVIIPNVITDFIYEKFYPNHKFEINNKVDLFIQLAFNPDKEFQVLEEMMQKLDTFIFNNKSVAVDEFLGYLNVYRFTEESSRYMGQSCIEIQLNEDKTQATVWGKIEFKNPVKGRRRVAKDYLIKLKHGKQGWLITRFDCEGLSE